MTTPVKGRSVLVVGLGRFGGGVGVSRWLVEQGARVCVTDLAQSEDLEASIEALDGLPIEWRLGGHEGINLAGIDLAVINPAVDKRRSLFFAEVASLGITWTTEINLFCERCPARVIGVTGSYGKSTTCAMLAEVLNRAAEVLGRAAGHERVFLGGNIGQSLLSDVGRMCERDIVVLEMSSAQLEDLPRIAWRPALAVITNIYPQHLDRHGTYETYARAKFNILGPGDQPLIAGPLAPPADEWLREIRPEGWVRPAEVAEGMAVPTLQVRGEHNAENARLVLAVSRELGLRYSHVANALKEFRGLPHRLEFVGILNGARVYNDSKSTAPAATLRALRAIEGRVVLLVGGRRKDVDWGEVAGEASGRCRHVVCFGEAGGEIAERFGEVMSSAKTSIHRVPNVAAAVVRGGDLVEEGDALLFSPGAQSFDAYANYVQRGEHFTALVRAKCGGAAERERIGKGTT
ncbi:MAG: hypothetical protein J5J06_17970 [Phycisphaerae bacterium]|nr:hypothetical protein [Phycisphaerae bacterium]